MSSESAALLHVQNDEPAEDLITMSALAGALKPREIVDLLDHYIVGQPEAKRAVAIALRNRWRRHNLPDVFKTEVIPKNILMIGPTGCGKTEIARRMAKLCQAPFIKVEATKFTEVGFHGKDVDQIIRDLLDVSISMTKKRLKEEVKKEANAVAEEQLIVMLASAQVEQRGKGSILELLRKGELDDVEVDMEVPVKQSGNEKGIGSTIFDFSNNPDFARVLAGGKPKKGPNKKKMKIGQARPILEDLEAEKMLEDMDITKEAISSVEESGIVFIDEIDKIVSSGDYRGADASSEGVQRDLLPLIEGSSISTKHGNVNTEFILFIASGAFHSAKPSDLLAELQGRLPIRVTLKGLSEDDMYRILTEPKTNLIKQQIELLKTENVELSFTDEAIKEIARVAFVANRTVENIGARRLHTIIERVIEEESFDAPDKDGQQIIITDEIVKSRVSDMLLSSDMRKYIL